MVNRGRRSTGSVQSYPDIVGPIHGQVAIRHPAGVQGPRLYNSDAFAAPQGLTYGNAGRNVLTLPHRTNFDMGLFKNFAVHEDNALRVPRGSIQHLQPHAVERSRQLSLLRRGQLLGLHIPDRHAPRTTREFCNWRRSLSSNQSECYASRATQYAVRIKVHFLG